MTISKDLLLAILSLDSYNRGYHSGISDGNAEDKDGLGDSSNGSIKIGTVSVDSNIQDAQIELESKAAGFYAISYKIDDGSKITGLNTNDTIIAYRGTAFAGMTNTVKDRL